MQAARIYFLPNLMTAGNLFCGFVAVIRCIQARQFELRREVTEASGLPPEALAALAGTIERWNQLAASYYTQAVWLLFAAVIFDSLDGRLARLGGKESLFGKEFDSLADVVSFGIAPALMMFFLILGPSAAYPWFTKVGWFLSFIYLLCGAVRLARFNVLTRPVQDPSPGRRDPLSRDFVGLPIPAAAGMIASLVFLVIEYDLKKSAIALPVIALLVAFLMVSTIRYPSFKQVDWSTKTRAGTFVILAVVAAGIAWLQELVLAPLFLTYLLYGLGRHLRLVAARRARRRLLRITREKGVNKTLTAIE